MNHVHVGLARACGVVLQAFLRMLCYHVPCCQRFVLEVFVHATQCMQVCVCSFCKRLPHCFTTGPGSLQVGGKLWVQSHGCIWEIRRCCLGLVLGHSMHQIVRHPVPCGVVCMFAFAWHVAHCLCRQHVSAGRVEHSFDRGDPRRVERVDVFHQPFIPFSGSICQSLYALCKWCHCLQHYLLLSFFLQHDLSSGHGHRLPDAHAVPCNVWEVFCRKPVHCLLLQLQHCSGKSAQGACLIQGPGEPLSENDRVFHLQRGTAQPSPLAWSSWAAIVAMLTESLWACLAILHRTP